LIIIKKTFKKCSYIIMKNKALSFLFAKWTGTQLFAQSEHFQSSGHQYSALPKGLTANLPALAFEIQQAIL